MKQNIQLLLFFWISSTLMAVLGYYILWLVMPNHQVFGNLYRMFLYHYQHPISYILIPCFFYGILATAFSNIIQKSNPRNQWSIMFLMIVLIILLSSLVGGMLWHYHDMQAGFFPDKWLQKSILEGSMMGLQIGWLIILLSVPYNIFGLVVCFYLTKKGIEIFRTN